MEAELTDEKSRNRVLEIEEGVGCQGRRIFGRKREAFWFDCLNIQRSEEKIK
jgi:hypothetical protein